VGVVDGSVKEVLAQALEIAATTGTAGRKSTWRLCTLVLLGIHAQKEIDLPAQKKID